VIICNKVGTEGKNVFLRAERDAAPTGSIMTQSVTEEEEILYATFTRDALYDIRMWIPVFRDRRPEMYDLIPNLFEYR